MVLGCNGESPTHPNAAGFAAPASPCAGPEIGSTKEMVAMVPTSPADIGDHCVATCLPRVKINPRKDANPATYKVSVQ